MKLSIGILPLESKADIILHPIKYKNSLNYEPLAEEAVMALLAKYFTYELVDEKVKSFFDEMDDGYLFSESNFDEFDLSFIKGKMEDKNEIIIGRDIFLHPQKENILKLANLLKLAGFEVTQFIENDNIEEISELDTFDGSIVYFVDDNKDEVIVSNQFKIANKINSNEIKIDNKLKKVVEDENLKGVFGIVFEENIEEYPFKRVKIN